MHSVPRPGDEYFDLPVRGAGDGGRYQPERAFQQHLPRMGQDGGGMSDFRRSVLLFNTWHHPPKEPPMDEAQVWAQGTRRHHSNPSNPLDEASDVYDPSDSGLKRRSCNVSDAGLPAGKSAGKVASRLRDSWYGFHVRPNFSLPLQFFLLSSDCLLCSLSPLIPSRTEVSVKDIDGQLERPLRMKLRIMGDIRKPPNPIITLWSSRDVRTAALTETRVPRRVSFGAPY